jgi:hypothetical protein
VLLGIDHLVVAVSDPDGGAAELENRLGLRATGDGRHDGLGTFNRLVWLGDSYLELVGVFDVELARRSWLGRPTVAALERGGGLITFALASDALARDVAALRSSGSSLAEPVPGERLRADGRTVRWQLSLPGQLGPNHPPFLIEHDSIGDEWTPEERAARARATHPLGSQVPVHVGRLGELAAPPQATIRLLPMAGRRHLKTRGRRRGPVLRPFRPFLRPVLRPPASLSCQTFTAGQLGAMQATT